MADSHSHKPKKLKQINKPFKGSKSNQQARKSQSAPKDWSKLNKKDRQNAAIQKRTHQRASLLRSRRNFPITSFTPPPALIGVLALNSQTDIQPVISQLSSRCENPDFSNLYFPNWACKDRKVQFISIERTQISVLDWCKVVDVLLVVSSCHSCQNFNIVSPETCPAFDQVGYTLLTSIRTQGVPTTVVFLSNSNDMPVNKQKQIKKIYTRYLQSEFPNQKLVIDNYQNLLRVVGNSVQSAVYPQWKTMRSYLFAQVSQIEGQIVLEGHIRGSGLLPNGSLIHITGHGDFQIQAIDTGHGFSVFESTNPLNPENQPDVFISEQTWPTEDQLAEAFSKLEVVPTDHVPNALIDQQEDQGEQFQIQQQKHKIQLIQRTREEMDFPDQVDTPNDVLCKQRFQKYRGLASIKHSFWDPYQNLPVEYGRLYEFKEPCELVKKHSFLGQSLTEYGQHVKLVVKNFGVDQLQVHSANLPLIISSVLPFENKLTLLHFRMERWGNPTEVLKSKQCVTLNFGFRRIQCRPIFSEDGNNSDKFVYLRQFQDKGTVVASIYGPSIFPPANVLLYKNQLLATGKFIGFEPKRIIIKRILLTGYITRSHKRKGVVRYMFFDPVDIKYFKPIELFTKNGLRGQIVNSIGTHGHMRCVFSDFVRHDDIVCMPLYKRVFPIWDPFWA